VKITDFGIAWSASSAPLTRTGQVVGTAHYLAPEQAAGHRAGPAGDVYALGLIGYECLAGHRAFDGENSVQIALKQIRELPPPLPDDVPAPVRTLLDRALAKDPAARFADGAAVVRAVDDVLAGRPLAPVPAGTAPLTYPEGAAPRRWRRALAPAAALLVGAALAVGGLQLASDGGEPDRPVQAADDDAPSALVLVADDWLGRPVGEVEAELGALGLQVTREAESTTSAEPGAVTGIGPTGAVSRGTVVTVRYAIEPDPVTGTAVPPPATEVATTDAGESVVPGPVAPSPEEVTGPAAPAAGGQGAPGRQKADPPGRGQPGVPGNGVARGKASGD
jgi:serine/threonine-protein kinase